MCAENEGAATPARVFAASSASCNCAEKCNPCGCEMQPVKTPVKTPAKTSWSGLESFHRTPEQIKQDDEAAALWKTNNLCAGCGKCVSGSFTRYSHDKMSKRGPVWCDRCSQRIEVQR